MELALAQHLRVLGGISSQSDGLDVISWEDALVTKNETVAGQHPHVFVGLGAHAT